jgi:hypothetical protein
MTSATFTTTVKGHVLIKDGKTGEVLLDKNNAVHNKNMALAIARGLANADAADAIGNHQVYKIKLGNGGSDIDSLLGITYLPPNITGDTADLYNPTYFEILDEEQTGTPSENTVSHLPSPTDDTSIVIATATIAAGEPTGQDLSDTPPDPNPNSQYAFDELGLFTYDDKLLTHIIFSPILKTSNRELVITYTLTISVS